MIFNDNENICKKAVAVSSFKLLYTRYLLLLLLYFAFIPRKVGSATLTFLFYSYLTPTMFSYTLNALIFPIQPLSISPLAYSFLDFSLHSYFIYLFLTVTSLFHDYVRLKVNFLLFIHS